MAEDATDALTTEQALLREAIDEFGPEDVRTTARRVEVAFALANEQQYGAAIREVSEVVRIRTAVLGPAHPDTLQAQSILILFLRHDEQWERSAAVYKQLLDATRDSQDPRAERRLGARVNYGIHLTRSGRTAEGEAELRDVLHMCEESLDEDHIVTTACRRALSRYFGRD
jgi:hypothetical protein